jgi:ketosteroid isomerase-like protein
MGTLNFVNLKVTPLDRNNELANVTGNWVVSKDSTQNSGLFSLVLKKTDNNWKIIIDHTW